MSSTSCATTSTTVWARSLDDDYSLIYNSRNGRFGIQSKHPGDPLHGTEFLARTLIGFLIGRGARTDFRLEIRRLRADRGVPFAIIHNRNRPIAAVCLSSTEPDFGRKFGAQLDDVSHFVVSYRVEPNGGKIAPHAVSLGAFAATLRKKNSGLRGGPFFDSSFSPSNPENRILIILDSPPRANDQNLNPTPGRTL